MKIGLSLSLLTLSVFALPGLAQTAAAGSQDPNRVVATINGQKVTAKQANDLLKMYTPEQRKQIDANFLKNFEKIYMQEQLADAALKMNLEQQQPWKDQLELTRRGILAQAYIGHLAEAAGKQPTEDPQKYYDAHKAEMETAKLSGIFIGFTAPGTPANSGATNARTEDAAKQKAQDIEKKLAAGGDFAALARSESEHQTASKGGDLGTVPINDPQIQIPAEIKNAVAKLQPGQVSEPIRINGAYLIIKLDARESVTFEKAKPGIEQKLHSEQSNDVIKKETEKYTVHVDDQDFFNSNGGTASIGAPKTPSLQRPAPASSPNP